MLWDAAYAAALLAHERAIIAREQEWDPREFVPHVPPPGGGTCLPWRHAEVTAIFETTFEAKLLVGGVKVGDTLTVHVESGTVDDIVTDAALAYCWPHLEVGTWIRIVYVAEGQGAVEQSKGLDYPGGWWAHDLFWLTCFGEA